MPKIFLVMVGFMLLSGLCQGQQYKAITISANAFKFKLDKLQGLNSTQNELDEKNNLFLRAVESPKNVIEIFDMATGDLKKTIAVKGFNFDSFTKVKDGRYWLYDSWKKTYFLIDETGSIIQTIKGTDRENIDLLSIGGKFNPIIFYNNSILSTGLFLFRKDLAIKSEYYKTSGVIRSIDLNNNAKYLGRITPNGQLNFYGNANRYSYTLNKNKLIVAPYFSDELQVIDLDKKDSKFYLLKSNYTNLIKPLSSIENFDGFTNAQNNDYLDKYPFLIGIVYDKYKDVYYRFVVEPGGNNINKISYSLYVIDKNFKILFYYNIPSGYSVANYFITKNGLHLLNRSAYQLNNAFLTYDLFKLN